MVIGDSLLGATGRAASVEALSLEAAGIHLAGSGRIGVDQRLRTSLRHI